MKNLVKENLVLPDLNFSLHIQHRQDSYPYGVSGGIYEAYMYLGVEVVYEYADFAREFPAGLEDFGGYVQRQFAQRLKKLLADE